MPESTEPMADRDDRIVQFDRLNLLGKAVFVTGAAVRVTASLLDAAIHRAADLWIEAEEAFKKELDPNLEDAKILEEVEDRSGTHGEATPPPPPGTAADR